MSHLLRVPPEGVLGFTNFWLRAIAKNKELVPQIRVNSTSLYTSTAAGTFQVQGIYSDQHKQSSCLKVHMRNHPKETSSEPTMFTQRMVTWSG